MSLMIRWPPSTSQPGTYRPLWGLRLVSQLLALGAALVLAGCGGVKIKDEQKASATRAVAEGYKQANVTETLKDEAINLQRLHNAELTVVQANHRVRKRFQLLAMAYKDQTVADWLVENAQKRLKILGPDYDDKVLELRRLKDSITNGTRTLNTSIKAFGGNAELVCAAPKLNITWDEYGKDLKLNDSNKENLKKKYENLAVACRDYPKKKQEISLGEIKAADDAKTSIEKRIRAQKALILQKQKELEGLKREYQCAARNQDQDAEKPAQAATPEPVQAAAPLAALSNGPPDDCPKSPGQNAAERKKSIQDAAEAYRKALQGLSSLDASIRFGVLSKERIGGLIEILTAVAGELTPTDQSADDSEAVEEGEPAKEDKAQEQRGPALRSALIAAETLPGLALDIAAYRERVKAPPVGGLILALNIEQDRLAYMESLQASELEQLSIHSRKLRALEQEAEAWGRARNEFCNLVRAAEPEFATRPDCVKFNIGKIKGPSGGDVAFCEIIDGQRLPIAKCGRLAKPWKDLVDNNNLSAPEKHAVWAALAAFAQASSAQRTAEETEYALVDLRHRRALMGEQAAINAWNTLIKVPIDQLAAYHDAGLTPADISSIIGNALSVLSLGGIAVGVNK